MTALLHIGSRGDEILDELRRSGVEILTSVSAVRPEPSVAVVALAPDVENPVDLARQLHRDAPHAHIVFLTTSQSDPRLRRELLVARIGTQWSIAPAGDPPAAARVVQAALEAAGRRQKLRTTINRLNLQLVAPAAPAARPTLISDHFLASVLDQLADVVVVLDRDHRILAFNEAAARAFGAMRRGSPVGESLPPEVSSGILTLGSTGAAAPIVFAAASGNEYELRVSRLADARGELMGTALVARDVTELRRDQKRRELVAASVSALASTLDVETGMRALASLLVADFAEVAAVDIVEGNTLNRHAATARGARERQLMEATRGINISNLAHPSVAAIHRGETFVRNDVDEAFLRSVATSEEHLRILRELRPRSIIVSPLRGEQIIGALLVARTGEEPFTQADAAMMAEIARETSAAVRNAWAFHAAAEASRLKDEFLATLSHELRTPMTSILGWAQLLRIGPATPQSLRDGLESIERSARAQSQLIDDLLDLSRMQVGKLQFTPRPFVLSSVVQAAVETIRPAARAKHVALTFAASGEVVVSGDPNRMQQVIWNLLSNAVKFSAAGSEVRVSVAADGDTARVTVADTGQGIAPDFLPHVFDRFRQGDASSTRRFGGLGLGLAIVKQLVELHGGRVEAASPGLGKGATFTVTLPVALADSVATVEANTEDSASLLPDLSGLHILVVDDDAALLTMLRAILERAGAHVQSVRSAAAALDALHADLPDLLISDVAMPDEDGASLIRSIRGTLRISADRLPAIALTAYTDTALRVQLLGLGFQTFMTKPVEAEVLARTVASLVHRRET